MKTVFTNQVLEVFMKHGDPVAGISMAKYMKNKFEYLGIRSPLRKQLTKEIIVPSRTPLIHEIPEIINELWYQPWREIQYFAIDLLLKYSKNPPSEWIEFYGSLITRKSWWDTVDGIAAWVVGDYFKRYPSQMPSIIQTWMNSGNIWLQRSCLIFQLRYGKNTDFQLLKSCILPLSLSREFFIQKAIGWSLRQYYRVEPEVVFEFVNQNKLSNLSTREALKHHH